MLKTLLHEPLLHFLTLGGLLFLFYSFSEQKTENNNHIVISKERIEQLSKEREKTLLTILTKEEKEKIIQQEIYENILYQEALKIGLDKNNADLKRHLAEKMAFVIYDTYELPTPSDEVLKEFMQKNPNDYREEQKIHFSQKIMGEDVMGFEKEYHLTLFEINNIFGRSFAEILFKVEMNGKAQKLESDYGLHEVLILSKSTPKVKSFNKVKEKLKNDYLRAQRKEKNSVIYEKIKSQYHINIAKEKQSNVF